jgi:hypothetical protein
MTDVLKALLAGALKTSSFPETSRYYGIDVATLQTSDGRSIAYLRRRFLPPLERFTVLQEHVVRQGDRLDNLAATYLGDPEQFWRLCDANGALWPPSLVEEPGRVIEITLPEGLAG